MKINPYKDQIGKLVVAQGSADIVRISPRAKGLMH